MSLSLRPVPKYTNVFLCGPKNSGKSTLLSKWVAYSREKKLALAAAKCSSSVATKKTNVKTQAKSPCLNDEEDTRSDDENDDNSKTDQEELIGPIPAPPDLNRDRGDITNDQDDKQQHQQSGQLIRAELIEVPKIRSADCGGSGEVVMFDVSGEKSFIPRWKDTYSSNHISAIIFVVDGPELIYDEKKMKEASALLWEIVEFVRSRTVALALIVNKIDLFPDESIRETILLQDGPIGKGFKLEELYKSVQLFEIFAASAVTGESIFNVLHFLSEWVVYPVRMVKHEKKRFNAMQKRNG